MTKTGSPEEEVEFSAKLEELRQNLERDCLRLQYHFDRTLHDRWIEADTGWRILLGRGLDIFQKPEGKLALGVIDQTKRRCKAGTITYSKQNS